MAKLHSNRQISVASVLLLLLAAFALTPPEYPCRTQSRNRQARTVRLDDHDSDHNRWSSHDLGNTGNDTQAIDLSYPLRFQSSSRRTLSNSGVSLCPIFRIRSMTRSSRLRNRAPPLNS